VEGNLTPSTELSRDLSLFHLTMMGLGMMIGAGVFLGIGNSIFIAGPGGVVLTFALNGVIAIFTAMSYAELSSAIPRAGGAYNFARIGFGRGPSFLAGWMEWFASSIAGSTYGLTFAIYTVRYLEHLGLLDWLPGGMTFLAVKIVAVAVVLFFIFINYRGASATGKIGAFFTLGQTLFMLFIGIVGLFVLMREPARMQNFKPFLPYGWNRLLITMGFTYVAFEGFEVIAQAGDESIEPRKNLPKAMLYSVLVATLTYVLVAFAAVVAVKEGSPGVDKVPWQWIGQFRERGFGEAVSRLVPLGNLLLTLAVIFASTSALNATVYSATRASYALGRDSMLPSFFARISKRRRTPWVALGFTAVIILFVATLLPTMDVASSASIMFLFLFFMVNICVIWIRVNMGDELIYGYVMPFFPLFPLAAILCQAVLAVWLVHMSWIAWIVAPVWISLGVVIYQIYSKYRVTASEAEIQVLEEESAPAGDEYRIMVALANPDNALELVGNAVKLCGAKKARVKLLHMVSIPDQVPLSDAGKYTTEGREGIVEAMLYLAPHFPITTTLRYCRNIARGIVSAVREKKVNMLLMGWDGTIDSRNFRLGRIVDPVIERSPCHIVISKGCGNRKFHRILVYLSGGPDDALALEVAAILVEKKNGVIVAMVWESGKGARLEPILEGAKKRIQAPVRIVTHVSTASNPVEGILEAAKDADATVLGYSRGMLSKGRKHRLEKSITLFAEMPLVLVKESRGLESITKRWL
jgi:APA family basic amino acid/polyamine antiporter